jgi:iron complex outermembrane receptor protein
MTWMDATFRDDFLACAGTPCAVADVPVAAGARIPGVPRTSAHVALQWGGVAGWHARLQAQHIGAVRVNTTDDESAPAYTVVGASTGYGFQRDDGDGRVFLAIGNLLDRRYAGSVIVNEGNRRYYEPAPGRNVTVGFEWRWRAALR